MKKEYNIYEFAKEVLDIDFTLAHQCWLEAIRRLNNKYGAGNWKLDFGRKGNPVVIINKKKQNYVHS